MLAYDCIILVDCLSMRTFAIVRIHGYKVFSTWFKIFDSKKVGKFAVCCAKFTVKLHGTLTSLFKVAKIQAVFSMSFYGQKKRTKLSLELLPGQFKFPYLSLGPA
jgi:hypothetical protein